MPIVAGPEQIDSVAANGVTSPFYLRPVFVTNGSDRWAFVQRTHIPAATWQIRAYLRVAGVWTVQDAANGPVTMKLFGAGGLDSGGSCPTYLKFPPDTTKVVAAYCRAVDSQLAFKFFDMNAKTWGAETAGGPAVRGDDVVFLGPPNSTYNDDTGAKVCVAYRPSDNKLLFNFQGALEVVAGANCMRPHFVTYDLTGLAWGVDSQLGFAGVYNPFQSHGLICDQTTSKSYATLIKPNGGTGATTFEIWYAQIDADDTIHAPVMITNDVLRQRESFVGYPKLQNNGGTVINIPFWSQSTGKIQIARAIVGIAPAFTIESISTGALNNPGGDLFLNPSVCIADDNNPYVFWGNSVAPDFAYRLWLASGGAIGTAWSAPSNIYTVADPANDFMEFLSVEFLPGI